jgi:indole-3-glycerol phosphate synthase
MTTTSTGADLLETIVAATRRIIDVRQTREPLALLRRRAERRPSQAGRLLEALSRADRLNVIAECKRRSPSRGVLRADYDAVGIAREYADAGAAAISVLTEPTFFDGSPDDLARVADAVRLPVLRKDFIVSDYQLLEARAAGAAAVLLIASALPVPELQRLSREANALGLDTLVEVHDRRELDAAVAAGARIIGVNNRNLRTLAVDVGVSEALIAHVPPDVVAVSESGLRSSADLVRLQTLGYRAFLVGERLMAVEHPGAALAALLG